MSKKIFIDSLNEEETKFFLLDQNNRIDEFDYQSTNKQIIKGNIYLGKVNRIEPALQAAFIECGLNKKCFLPFDLINSNYFQIPVADRDKFKNNITKNICDYKIQEVIKKDQVILVQVEKEERGNKGACLTTFISISGRFCVYHPNALRPGVKISRRLDDENEVSRLKLLADDMIKSYEDDSIILRTASAYRTKTEISRDFHYIRRIWNNIKKSTLSSFAPSLVYEESDLLINSIKNFYTSDVKSIVVSGKKSFIKVRDFIKIFSPNNVDKVKYHNSDIPLIYKYKLDSQYNQFFLNKVQLESGGYFVINITEALISIDVNSGKYTGEYNIENTALKINLEAASEIARQVRFRGLSGLIVIDFIDMSELQNKKAVEKELRKLLWNDRAKIQFGKISELGLFEMSRQRIGRSFFESNTTMCDICEGKGKVFTNSSISLLLLEKLKYKLHKKNYKFVYIFATSNIVIFINNNYRNSIISIEALFNTKIIFHINDLLLNNNFRIVLKSKLHSHFENKANLLNNVYTTHLIQEDGTKIDKNKNKKLCKPKNKNFLARIFNILLK